jgi:demethylmenaquinone methyltransferase/2-methoxy-6-polyprenyl-1,4-benzoquinol methylase
MLDKKPSTIGGMFDGIAATYDRLNTILSFSTDRLWRRIAIRRLDIQKDDLVLDIATGTGDLLMLALSKVRCKAVGIDLSGEMISVAVNKLRTSGFSDRAFFVAGDALNLPFPESSFNRAMVAFGIRNMQRLEDFLDEVFRILVEKGRLAVLEFSLPSNPFFSRLYLAYFGKLIPCIGGYISGDKKAYKYLCDSVVDFAAPSELEALMKAHGYDILHSERIFFGIAHLFILQKGRNTK